jgi:hypothetical protein
LHFLKQYGSSSLNNFPPVVEREFCWKRLRLDFVSTHFPQHGYQQGKVAARQDLAPKLNTHVDDRLSFAWQPGFKTATPDNLSTAV